MVQMLSPGVTVDKVGDGQGLIRYSKLEVVSCSIIMNMIKLMLGAFDMAYFSWHSISVQGLTKAALSNPDWESTLKWTVLG